MRAGQARARKSKGKKEQGQERARVRKSKGKKNKKKIMKAPMNKWSVAAKRSEIRCFNLAVKERQGKARTWTSRGRER